MEDDIIAVNHLVRAKMKVFGSEFEPTLTEIITKMMQRIDRKSMQQFGKPSDVF